MTSTWIVMSALAAVAVGGTVIAATKNIRGRARLLIALREMLLTKGVDWRRITFTFSTPDRGETLPTLYWSFGNSVQVDGQSAIIGKDWLIAGADLNRIISDYDRFVASTANGAQAMS